jgi:uncharacterized iron-regulated protein
MKIMLLTFLLSNMAFARNWDGVIFNTKTEKEISSAEYTHDLANFSLIVLGEKHYTKAVQLAEAKTIHDVVTVTGKTGAFTTGWEFLNVTTQLTTEELFNKVLTKEITSEDFLVATQGNTPTSTYAPVIDTTASLGGKILGLNLSRSEKNPVTMGGLSALDPKLLPPQFNFGTAGYFERFSEIMQGHTTPDQLKNYYASQCLVDDVMAYHFLRDSSSDLKFLIAGSFHTDYYDGAVNRLKIRDPQLSIVTIKIIDASDFSEDQLLTELHDEKYGDIADFVYFVNEPRLSTPKESATPVQQIFPFSLNDRQSLQNELHQKTLRSQNQSRLFQQVFPEFLP